MANLSLGAGMAQENPNKAPSAPTAGEVVGKVVTPEDKPVADAAVFWLERSDDGVIQRRFVEHTDAQGRFRFAQPPPKPDEAYRVNLLVQTPDWGLSFQSLAQFPRPAGLLTIRLLPATALRIGFTDPAGKPLPNLPVRVAMLFDPQLGFLQIPESMKGRWVQKTDAKGECVFPGLPQGVQARFAVEDERFATLSYQDGVDLAKTATQQANSIRLLPGGTVQGQVTFADTGKPAAGVRVAAQANGVGEGWAQAFTDEKGSYRLTSLPSGSYNIALYLRDDLEKNWTARALEKMEVKPGTTLERQDFRLIKGSLLTGKVTDKETGKPIEGAMIGIYGPAHPRSSSAVQSAKTGPDGVYQLRVPPGEQYVYVMGLPSTKRYEAPREGHNVTLGEAATQTQDFTLLPSVAQNIKPIRVRVVGTDGKPVAKAKVTVTQVSDDDRSSGGLGRVVEAGDDGNLLLELPVASARLRARSGALATEKTTLAQSGEEVTLQLKPNVLVTLSGQVMDDKGKPVPGAKVTLVEWWLDNGVGGAGIPVDAQGRYTFADLWPDGRYSFSAEAPGYGTQYTRVVAYQPGEKATIEALTLPRADGFVAGRVVDENGDPVAKEAVELQGGSNRPQQAFTDAQGRFRFEKVVKGQVTLYLHDNQGRFAPNPKRANTGDSDLILVKKSPAPPKEDSRQEDARQKRMALLRQKAPALQTSAWLNTTAKLPDGLQGKIVLIDFWATTCGPCVATLPAVQKVFEQFAKRGVVVVGLHAGGIEKQELADFVKAHKLTYPIAIDIEDPQHLTLGQTMSQYGVHGIPEVAVLDRKGIVVYLGGGLEGAVGIIGNLLANEK